MIGRRAGLLAASVAASLLLLETGTRLLHRVTEGEPFPADALRERLAPAVDPDRVLLAREQHAPEDGGRKIANKVLHPYLGFVFDRAGGAVNRYGFPGPDPLEPPGPDAVRVAITGGSVAMQVFEEGGGPLRESLAPAFPGKRIELIALCLGGYKQPQQLMTLAWMLSLGAHFDAIINLDGFNEVVLPFGENDALGVHVAFPRSWHLYQSTTFDGARADYVSEAQALVAEQNRWRRRLGTGLPARSAFVLTLLDRIDTRSSEQLAERAAAYRARLNEHGLDFQSTGPYVPFESNAELFQASVDVWKRSSLEMHALAEGAGAHYVHFLQPNQWVPRSKVLSGVERRQLRVRGPFVPRDVVPQTYPMLGRAGLELHLAGVAFHNLVLLFEDEPRTVYRDTCCHLNALGVETLARSIGEAAAADLR